ncbi:MAG: hypothetical protein U0350_10155 [Caldilineaceae bacterium]
MKLPRCVTAPKPQHSLNQAGNVLVMDGPYKVRMQNNDLELEAYAECVGGLLKPPISRKTTDTFRRFCGRDLNCWREGLKGWGRIEDANANQRVIVTECPIWLK